MHSRHIAQRSSRTTMKWTTLLTLSLFFGSAAAQHRKLQPTPPGAIEGQYIVRVREGVDPKGAANGLLNGQAFVLHTYTVINGFAATNIPPGLLRQILDDPDVEIVEQVRGSAVILVAP